MPPRIEVLNHMGGYTKHGPVKAFCDISEKTFDTFHTVMGGHDKQDDSERNYLISRLTYIAEVTSTAIRLNASWALTHAAMSLTRDRYEQVVRFSWLARQTDDAEMMKFFAYYNSRANKIFRSLQEQAKEEFSKLVDSPPEWTTRPLTPEEKARFGAWETLDLLSLVKKRDKLPALGKSQMAVELLEIYYAPVYQQFSSVSHADMYAVALLQLHKAPSGGLVLAPDPYWPAMLTCFNALFDIVECFECAAGFYEKPCEDLFQTLFQEWTEVMKKTVGFAER